MKKRKIGFFGGTFDPIHFGHLNLAIELFEKCSLDEVLFSPVFISPFKKNSPSVADPEKRAEMIRLAIEGFKGFSLTDIEIKRGGVSYTVDSLKMLSEKFPKDAELHLLIAEDSLFHFHRWKDYSEILELAPPFIGCRSNLSVNTKDLDPTVAAKLHKKNFILTRQMDVSSTDIRLRLKNNLYCGHLVPAKVLDYIHLHGLYSKV